MITIFTIPKSFDNSYISIIQYNAISSWTKIKDCEVILVGDDEGVSEVASKLNIKHIPDVKINEQGTPLLDSAFELVKKNSKNDILVYVNADIILTKNLIKTIEKLPTKKFLAVGQRIDLDVNKLIDFNDLNWETNLEIKSKKEGEIHSFAGIDYFIFQKESFENIPPFAVGRIGWDNWMIYEAKKKKMKVVDVTNSMIAIHQNHDYPDLNKGKARKTNPEAIKNISFIKNKRNTYTIEDANWKMTKQGLKRNHLHWLPLLKRTTKQFLGI